MYKVQNAAITKTLFLHSDVVFPNWSCHMQIAWDAWWHYIYNVNTKYKYVTSHVNSTSFSDTDNTSHCPVAQGPLQ